jgi:hypothetical protein
MFRHLIYKYLYIKILSHFKSLRGTFYTKNIQIDKIVSIRYKKDYFVCLIEIINTKLKLNIITQLKK